MDPLQVLLMHSEPRGIVGKAGFDVNEVGMMRSFTCEVSRLWTSKSLCFAPQSCVVSVVTSFSVLHGMRRSLKLYPPSGRALSSSQCEGTYSGEGGVYGYIYELSEISGVSAAGIYIYSIRLISIGRSF